MQNMKHTLRSALEERGVDLAPVLSPEEWGGMMSNALAHIALDAKGIYGDFNGFIHCDHKSQIRLWTIKQIVEKNDEIKLSYSPSSFLIGDVLIESNYIFYEKISSLIFIDGYDGGVFKNISEILESLVKGNFDLF